MENTAITSPQAPAPENKKQSLTPHELVRRHMENPDEPITDEDMENINLSLELQNDEKAKADQEADELTKDNTGTSYAVLDA